MLLMPVAETARERDGSTYHDGQILILAWLPDHVYTSGKVQIDSHDCPSNKDLAHSIARNQIPES